MIRRAALILAISIAVPTPALAQDPAPTAADAREHTVVAGETLWSIARAYYGSPFEWRRIYEANQANIANPNWIEPGQQLVIPGGGPAMAAGCPIVIKPSINTPLSAYAVGELCAEIGLPPGVVNIIAGTEHKPIGDRRSPDAARAAR